MSSQANSESQERNVFSDVLAFIGVAVLITVFVLVGTRQYNEMLETSVPSKSAKTGALENGNPFLALGAQLELEDSTVYRVTLKVEQNKDSQEIFHIDVVTMPGQLEKITAISRPGALIWEDIQVCDAEQIFRRVKCSPGSVEYGALLTELAFRVHVKKYVLHTEEQMQKWQGDTNYMVEDTLKAYYSYFR